MPTSARANIQVVCTCDSLGDDASKAAKQLYTIVQDQPVAEDGYVLLFESAGVSLSSAIPSKQTPIKVDFTTGGAAHRRKFGGGNGQLIAKAAGLQGACRPQILDATAGLGGDGFVLATLGSQVTLMERSPVAYALLADGLRRANRYAEEQDAQLLEILQRIQLREGDSIQYLGNVETPAAQVIYLDPMFPERTKSAAVKKEMQIFHALLGTDTDDADLLNAALNKAIFRVVVKRPRLAPAISVNALNGAANLILEGKSCRYDVYTRKKITPEALAAP